MIIFSIFDALYILSKSILSDIGFLYNTKCRNYFEEGVNIKIGIFFWVNYLKE